NLQEINYTQTSSLRSEKYIIIGNNLLYYLLFEYNNTTKVARISHVDDSEQLGGRRDIYIATGATTICGNIRINGDLKICSFLTHEQAMQKLQNETNNTILGPFLRSGSHIAWYWKFNGAFYNYEVPGYYVNWFTGQ